METNNRSIKEIEQMYNELTQCVRHYVSAKLIDTSEDNKMEVNIELDGGDCGLSSLEKPTIVSIWQHPTEGWIDVLFSDSDIPVDWDYLDMADQIKIAKELQ